MAGIHWFLQVLGLRPRCDAVHEARGPAVALSDPLGRFVQAVSTAADEHDPSYEEAVAGLRRDPEALAAEVSRLAFRDARDEYALLRCAAMALGAVGAPAVIAVLVDLATAQHVPNDGDPEASMHAMTVNSSGVEALEHLARSGVVEAADALVDVVRRDVSLTVRGVALVALRDVGTEGQVEEATSFISGTQRHLLDLRRVSVLAVPQVTDPRRHLLGQAGPTMVRPDLGGGEQDGPAASDTPRARPSLHTEERDDG